MRQFIIEMGSGNTCRNDIGIVREMIDAVAGVDSGKHDVILKWQLFESAPPNEPLLWRTFAYAYGYAWERGFCTTASVFDRRSLLFLRRFEIPFIKIANRPNLRYLTCEDVPYYVSYSGSGLISCVDVAMACVSEYPADIRTYQERFTGDELRWAVSDHTVGWDLYHLYNPKVIEKHFVLKHDSDNPDGGPFAVTPAQLAEVL